MAAVTTQHARRPTLLSLGLLALLWHCSLESEGQAPNTPPDGMPTEGSGGSDQSGAGQGGTAGGPQGAGGVSGAGGTGGAGGGTGGSDAGGMAGTAGMAGSAGMAGAGGSANCPADQGEFEIAGIGGRCFFMLTSSGGPQRTWDQAKNDCQGLAYALTSLPTKAEYEAVRTYLVRDLGVTGPDSSNSVWIGASTAITKEEGGKNVDVLAASFEWVNGTSWSFNTALEDPWGADQPDYKSNGDIDERCIEMRSESRRFDFRMNNVTCNTPRNFALCERPFSR